VTDLTDRATVDEKAEAWDKVMGAAGDRAIALAAACVWLRATVEAREAAERVAEGERLAVEGDNIVHFRVIRDAGWEDPR
jgi:hypothetical protein